MEGGREDRLAGTSPEPALLRVSCSRMARTQGRQPNT